MRQIEEIAKLKLTVVCLGIEEEPGQRGGKCQQGKLGGMAHE